jgi:hypothetical protein
VKIWTRIKQLSIPQLWKLSVLFLKNPRYILPSLQATKQTFAICNSLFGKEHNKSNPANAFRHALWNVLLCKKGFAASKDKQKSVFWAQKLTDVYEKVTQNAVLDEAMDLHNNAVGRIYFLNLITHKDQEVVDYILKETKKAYKVASVEEIKPHKTHLVFIHL